MQITSSAYTKSWSARQPGCLIFLLDQSASMDDPFGGKQVGGGQKKCDAVAAILNHFLNEIITLNTVVHSASPVVRPRADVAVLGYGHQTATSIFHESQSKDFLNLAELQTNPLAVETQEKQELDGSGAVVKIPVSVPIWVRPHAVGGTPMVPALRKAKDLAHSWVANHQDSYPPVVINVTDGMANGNLEEAVQDLTQIHTNDGNVLYFTVHLTDQRYHPVEYPASTAELPDDPYAQRLFNLSSLIPENSHDLLNTLLGRSVPPGARGMIYNGDASSVHLMFNFASAPAVQPVPAVDPDR